MKTVRLGILGYGHVVQGLLEQLTEKHDYLKVRYNMDIRVHGICDSTELLTAADGLEPGSLLALKLAKNAAGDPLGGVAGYAPGRVVEDFLSCGVNTVLEALPTRLGSAEPALSWLLAFLEERVPLVLADKSPLVYGFERLLAASRKSRTPFRFGGAAGAALPVADVISTCLAGSELFGFEGILNGTTNMLLSEMIANHSSIEEELEIAKELKITESDPQFDVQGWDTAFKTLILAKAYMDPAARIEDVQVQGLEGITYAHVEPALKKGSTLKLLGKASFEGNRLRLRVKPSVIPPTHPFFPVNGTNKAVTFYTDSVGQLTLFGGASGARETAGALLRDVVNINRDINFL